MQDSNMQNESMGLQLKTPALTNPREEKNEMHQDPALWAALKCPSILGHSITFLIAHAGSLLQALYYSDFNYTHSVHWNWDEPQSIVQFLGSPLAHFSKVGTMLATSQPSAAGEG